MVVDHHAIAQQGQELDTLGRFKFLHDYPKSGHYILDITRNVIGDSTARIHFLNEADFAQTQFDYQVNFPHAQFNAQVDFSMAQFDSQTDFSWAQFDSQTNFSWAQFDSLVYFSGVQFDSLANFSEARFNSQVYFFKSLFNAQTTFNETHFDSEADFSLAQFDSQANFSLAQFNSRANYYQVQFDSKADFSETQFNALADFSQAQFDSLVNFSEVQFDSLVNFTNAQFKGPVLLANAILADRLIFENVKLQLTFNLTVTQLDPVKKAQGRFCFIDLRDAPIEKFKLRYDKFRVYLPEEINTTEYERLTNVYEGLLKNFKDRGYLTSYATLDKEYQAFKDLRNPDAGTFKKFLNKVNHRWNNYGHNKEWIWFWTGGLLFLSTLINWLAFPYLIKKVYPVPVIDEAIFDNNPESREQFVGSAILKGKVYLNFQHFIFAFYYTCLLFFGLKLTTERVNFKMHLGVILIFTEYLLGLICLGYLANYIISSGLIGK